MHLAHRSTSGLLPTSSFDLANDAGDVIGDAQLRHRPSQNADLPPEAANHIYYEIAEPHRGQGHGKALLALLLDEARRIGLDRVRLNGDNRQPSQPPHHRGCRRAAGGQVHSADR
jgi:predicted acetyltransferase